MGRPSFLRQAISFILIVGLVPWPKHASAVGVDMDAALETPSFTETRGSSDAQIPKKNSDAAIPALHANNHGNFTYTIALDVPQGVGNMTPALSLAYNSGNYRNTSPWGVGWTLSIPSIHRSTRQGFPAIEKLSTGTRYLESDAVFESSEGELARTTQGPSGSEGALYAPMRENFPVRYERLDNHWVEHAPNGNKRFYGDDAIIRNELGIHHWLLTSHVDPFGNRVDYEYHLIDDAKRADLTRPQKLPIVSRIAWGGSDTVPHRSVAEFEIEELEPHAQRIDMLAGHVWTTHRVTKIRMGRLDAQGKVLSELYFEYALEQETSPTSARSQLVRVIRRAPGESHRVWTLGYSGDAPCDAKQPCFSSEKSISADPVYTQQSFTCLAPLTCDDGVVVYPSSDVAISPPGRRSASRFMDTNADGIVEHVYHPAGFSAAESRMTSSDAFINGLPPVSALTDLDRDGDVDAVSFGQLERSNGGGAILPSSGDIDGICGNQAFRDRCGDIDPLPEIPSIPEPRPGNPGPFPPWVPSFFSGTPSLPGVNCLEWINACRDFDISYDEWLARMQAKIPKGMTPILPSKISMEMVTEKNISFHGNPSRSGQAPTGMTTKTLHGWPRGVEKQIVIKDHSMSRFAPRFSSVLVEDFLAPMVDLNGDAHADILLLKEMRNGEVGLRRYHMVPRAFIQRDGEFFRDTPPPVLNPSSGYDQRSDFTQSLDGLLGNWGRCSLNPNYPCELNFTTLPADINGDGLTDLIIAAKPRAGDNTWDCPQEHALLLNRGYRFSTPSESEIVSMGLSQAFGKINNRDRACNADQTSSAGYQSSAMTMADINGDGHDDVIISVQDPVWKRKVDEVYFGTERGFRSAPSMLPSNFPGFAVTPAGLSKTRQAPISAQDMGRLGDMDGDGLADLIRAGWISGPFGAPRVATWQRNTGEVPDLLTRIDEPQGGRFDLGYLSGAQALQRKIIANDHIGLPMQGQFLVSVVHTPLAPDFVASQWMGQRQENYTYGSYHRDHAKNLSLGFGTVHASVLITAPAQQLTRSLEVEEHYEVLPTPQDRIAYARLGRLVQRSMRTALSERVERHAYDVTPGDGAWVRVRTLQTDSTVCEGRIDCITHRVKMHFDDVFRDPVEIESGDIETSGAFLYDASYTSTVRKVQTFNASWIVGNVVEESVWGQSQSHFERLSQWKKSFDDITGVLREVEHARGNSPDACSDMDAASVDAHTDFTHDSRGRLIRVDGPADDVSGYTYDDIGIYPETSWVGPPDARLEEQFEYDLRHGKPTAHTDANLNKTRFTYDSHGRILSVQDPNGGTREIHTYNDVPPFLHRARTFPTISNTVYTDTYVWGERDGFLTVIKPSDGSPRRKHASVTDGDGSPRIVFGAKAITGTDAASFLLAALPSLAGLASNPHPLDESISYHVLDGFGRRTMDEDPAGRKTLYHPKLRGVATDYPDGRHVLRYDDHAGHAVEVIHDDDIVYRYVRNGLGAIEEIEEPGDVRRGFTYNLLGHRVATSLPGYHGYGQEIVSCFDAKGRILARQWPSGRHLAWERDALGRAVSIENDYPGLGGKQNSEVMHIEYDKAENGRGRVSELSNAAGTWRYGYDVFGNTEVNHYQPSDALRWNNVRSNLTALATHHPNGTVANELSIFETGDRRTQFMASYGYDAQGRALGASIFGADGMAPVVHDVHYNVDGALDGILWPHDVRLNIAYHPQLRSRAAILVTRDRLGELFSITHNAFDNADRLTSETQRLRDHLTTSKFYSYDTMGRLNSNFRSAARSSALEQYAFDDAGNITAAKGLFGIQTYRYDDEVHPHAVTSVNTRSLSYDADGVLKQDGNSQFVFDAFGCLREVKNADGNRMMGLCGPDGNQMYRESRVGETGPPRDRRFEFGERLRLRPDENVSEFRMVLGALPVFVQQRSLLTGARIADGTRYLHPDLRGSVVATTVAGIGRATIAQTAMFDAWGSRRPWNSYDKLPRHGFIGMEPDPLHARYAMGKRLYDPTLRRFVQPDPLFLHAPEKALHDGVELNLWQYARGNPIAFTDRTGEVADAVWDAASLMMGFQSIASWNNQTSTLSKATDVAGVAMDGIALAIPFVPGGVGAGIKASRIAESSVEISRNSARNLLASRGVDKITAKQIVASFDGPITATRGKAGDSFTVTESARGTASGNFVTRGSAGSAPAERIQNLALPPSNTALVESRVELTRPQILLEGRAASQPQWGVPGGGHQVVTNGGRRSGALEDIH